MLPKLFFLMLCLIGTSIAVVSTTGADAPQPQQDDTSKQLESLLKERRDTLSKVVDLLDARFRSGFGGIKEETVLPASNHVLDAELELAPTKAKRVAIREKVVANLRKVEKFNEMRRKGPSLAPPEDLLQAKAARLKAEIQLLREKAGNELPIVQDKP
jgi:hypothetical protein